MTIHQLYIMQVQWNMLTLNDSRKSPALVVDECAVCGEPITEDNAGQLNLCQECWEHHCAVTVPPWFDDRSEPYWQNAGC